MQQIVDFYPDLGVEQMLQKLELDFMINVNAHVSLLVPYAPTSIMFGPDCPGLEFVDVFWQVR